jgi:hypothetical protein
MLRTIAGYFLSELVTKNSTINTHQDPFKFWLFCLLQSAAEIKTEP